MVDRHGELDEGDVRPAVVLGQLEPQAFPPLLIPFDQVEAAGVGAGDPPGLEEDLVEQGIVILLGGKHDPDAGELAQLPGACRYLPAGKRLSIRRAEGQEQLSGARRVPDEPAQSFVRKLGRHVGLPRGAQYHYGDAGFTHGVQRGRREHGPGGRVEDERGGPLVARRVERRRQHPGLDAPGRQRGGDSVRAPGSGVEQQEGHGFCSSIESVAGGVTPVIIRSGRRLT